MATITETTPKAKQLEAMFGGKWRYHKGSREWWDGDKRTVRAAAMCDCDDTCPHPPAYWLYGDGAPRRVHFYSKGLL